MGRLIFDLTDEDRAALEAHRVRLGLRSHAETLRVLIRTSDRRRSDVEMAGLVSDFDGDGASSVAEREAARLIASVEIEEHTRRG